MAKRPLWIVVVLLLAAAAALWGANQVTWSPEASPAPDPDTGGITGTGTGSGPELADGAPGLTPLALLAIAGLAGVFAVGGWTRRLLGAILVLAGGFACARALSADVPGGFALLTGRGIALAGGLLLAAAGVLVAWFAARLPTMGSRYQLANAGRRSGDPDKDMWDGLSGGEDPTADGR